MSDISDPGRAGRGDRKRARKLIDAAYAAGRISAADRAHRTQRVESAYTKGDLAVIVRDLDRAGGTSAAAAAGAVTTPTPTPDAPPARTSLGSAIPKDQFDAMLKGGSARTIDVSDAVRTSLAGSGVVQRVRKVVLFAVVGFVLLCGVGVASIVGLAANFGDGGAPGDALPTPSLNLQTAAGWREWVDAVEKETGTTRVYDAVVYPDYASVNAVVDEGAMRYLYRNGAFQLSNSPVTAATTEPVDLADIDPDMVAGLPEQTAEHQKMPDYDSAYMIVNQWSGEPSIMVYLQQTGKLSRWSIYDFTGAVVGGTPG